MLNDIVECIIHLKEQHTRSREQYREMETRFQKKRGSMVVAMGKIHLNNDGRMPDMGKRDFELKSEGFFERHSAQYLLG